MQIRIVICSEKHDHFLPYSGSSWSFAKVRSDQLNLPLRTFIQSATKDDWWKHFLSHVERGEV